MKQSNHYSYRIYFEFKEGCTIQDTIIEIGQAKAASIRAYIKRMRRENRPIPDLIELSQRSRGELRKRNFK